MEDILMVLNTQVVRVEILMEATTGPIVLTLLSPPTLLLTLNSIPMLHSLPMLHSTPILPTNPRELQIMDLEDLIIL